MVATASVLCLLSLLLLPTPSRSAVPLSLALAKTYLENPRLAAARARLRAVDEEVPLARAERRPRARASSSAIFSDVETASERTTLETLRAGIELEQPLYTGGRAKASIERAKRRREAERAELEAVEQDVLLSAIAAFVDVIRDQNVLELALRNESRLLQQLEAVRKRFRFGELTRTDVSQAEARYARAVAAREEAEGDLEAAGAAYRRTIGDPPGTLIDPPLPPGQPQSLSEALEAVDDNPSVRAARLSVEAAERGVERAKAERKPRLVFDAEAGYVDEPSTLVDWQRDFSIGTKLTIPLYEAGAEFARIRQSRQLLAERRHLAQDAVRAAEQEIITAWERREAARQRLASLRRQEAAAILALDGVREEAQLGIRTVLDSLDAEQEAFDAQVAVNEAQRDEILAAYRLLAAQGRLTAQDLALDAVLYDPDAYYEEINGAWFGSTTSRATDGRDAVAVR